MYKHAVSLIRENYRPPSIPVRLFATLLRILDANQLDIPHIHTIEDTIEGIKPEVLEETTDLAEVYIREVDSECGLNTQL